jgi:Protein of unknown function (DUF3558)
MARSRTPGKILGSVALALVIAGCGASSSSKSSGTNSPASRPADSSTSAPAATTGTPKDLCTVISTDDAAKIFGESAESRPPTTPTPFVTGICFYHHPGDGLDVRNLLQIRIYPGEKFFSAALFPNSQTVSGLGDKAFSHVNTVANTVQVDFVKNGKTGSVFYSAGHAVDVPSKAAAVQDIAKKLAASI